MKKISRGCAIMLILVMLFSLSACGCKHEWEEATCTSPKTCLLCGETEGEALEHEFTEATCIRPEFCMLCGEERGERLGHSYSDGYCIVCSEKDPNYVNLNNFGFRNMYGMTTWVEITGYNLSEGWAYYNGGYYGSEVTKVWSFENSYIKHDTMGCDDLIDGIVDMDSPTVRTNYNVNNDVSETGWGDWIIIDRVVAGDYLILKTQFDGDEEWYVPTDLLNLSRTSIEPIKNKAGEDITSVVLYFK